jgi:hypothetical protein
VVTGPTVTIAEGQWSVNTDRIDSAGDAMSITVTNATSEDQTFLIINLWEGSAEDLPLTPDGLLDLSMANVSVDMTRPASRYGLVHPESGGGALPTLAPGETLSITVGQSGGPNPGTYLVISGDANAVNTGRYARFDIGQPSN